MDRISCEESQGQNNIHTTVSEEPQEQNSCVIILGNLSCKTSSGPKHLKVATVLPIFNKKIHMKEGITSLQTGYLD